MTRENLINRARMYSRNHYWSSQSSIWEGVIENLETEKDIKVGYYLGLLHPVGLVNAQDQFLDLHNFLLAVSEFYEER